MPTAKDTGTGEAAATEEANTAVLVASTRGATVNQLAHRRPRKRKAYIQNSLRVTLTVSPIHCSSTDSKSVSRLY